MTFSEWIEENYNRMMKILKSYCKSRGYKFSEDLYHNTLYAVLKIESKGEKINYQTIDDYLFVIYKNFAYAEERKSYNTKRDVNYHSDNLNSLGKGYSTSETYDDLMERERIFQENYNTLVFLEHNVYENLGDEYGQVFTKKMNGEKLSKKGNERKKLEHIKRYIKNNDYFNLKKI